jgi:allantoate deiminase
MLFVRCKDGISHHPDESVRPDDVAVALGVVVRFLRLLDPTGLLPRKDR